MNNLPKLTVYFLLISCVIPHVGSETAWCRDTKAVNLGEVPFGDVERAVRVVPWSVLPGDIQQMAFAGESLYFATREGKVWQYDTEGTRTSTPFLDLSKALRSRFKATNSSGLTVSAGLRGIAFHPDFDTPDSNGFGKFYTQHAERFGSAPANHELNPDWTKDGTRLDSVLVEWSIDAATQRIDINSARDVYRVQFPFGRHPGQQIGFNPAAQPGDTDYGNLYIAFGDSGSRNSDNLINFNRVQGTDTPLGTVVRINPLQTVEQSFSIPEDNPFVGEGDDALDEIYAFGFRHPQTIGFDPHTGQLFVGDMGQSNVEEINLIEPGANYGYGTREGTYVFTDQVQGSTAADSSLREVLLDVPQSMSVRTDDNPNGAEVTVLSRIDDEFTYPVLQFDHQSQNTRNDLGAVVAGSVYRGQLAAELTGLYLFGNLSNDDVFYANASDLVNDQSPAEMFQLPLLDESGTPTSLAQVVGLSPGGRVNMRFGQDQDGEIYVISKHDDTIYRLEGTLVPEPATGFVAFGAAAFALSKLTRRRR